MTVKGYPVRPPRECGEEVIILTKYEKTVEFHEAFVTVSKLQSVFF